jgi:hypothetical protein
MVVGGIESEQQDSAATIDLDQGLGGREMVRGIGGRLSVRRGLMHLGSWRAAKTRKTLRARRDRRRQQRALAALMFSLVKTGTAHMPLPPPPPPPACLEFSYV